MHEGKYIVDPKGVATHSSDAYKSGKAKDQQALGKEPKLDTLLQDPRVEYRKQGREIARSLGFQDELTPAEYTAVDQIGEFQSNIPDQPGDVMLDPDMLFGAIENRMVDSIILKRSGIKSNNPASNYGYGIPDLVNEYEQLLGCDYADTMTYDRTEPSSRIGFDTLDEFLDNKLIAREATTTRYAPMLPELDPMLDHMIVEYNGMKFLYSSYDDLDTITFCF